MVAQTMRPVILSTHGMVTSGHYLASSAGLRILQQGGNAIDAAAATCFCQNLVEPAMCGLGGEVPTLIYVATEKQVYAVSGMGWSPATFTIAWCRENGIELIPGDGYLPACVPAVVDTWITALARFGTLSLSQVLHPALELARDGFPVYRSLAQCVASHAQRFARLYPSTAEIYCPDGHPPQPGERLRNPSWAWTIEQLLRAEKQAQHRGRIAGLEAASDAFYRGEIAGRIADFVSANPVPDSSGVAHRGLLSYEDIATWHAQVEEPVALRYHGYDVFKCPPWTQGPVFLQQLALLAGYDLADLGHNSADYLHLIIECAKLAFADREAYYGDPAQDDVPFGVLLSEGYNAARRALITAEASADVRPGDVGRGLPAYAAREVVEDNRLALSRASSVADGGGATTHQGDTTHLDVCDVWGNMVAATPSGGWIPSSPVIRGLGFPLGTRGQMFYLNPQRPNALAPHKRPRATLTPTIITRDGEPYLAFGTEGGDAQDQTSLQFLLNCLHFGLDVQAALEAPTVYSLHFPSSFYPREAHPRLVACEEGIPEAVLTALREHGHEVLPIGSYQQGKATAIRLHRQHGVMEGGAAHKSNGVAHAMGW